jgi:hypothetical protein
VLSFEVLDRKEYDAFGHAVRVKNISRHVMSSGMAETTPISPVPRLYRSENEDASISAGEPLQAFAHGRDMFTQK